MWHMQAAAPQKGKKGPLAGGMAPSALASLVGSHGVTVQSGAPGLPGHAPKTGTTEAFALAMKDSMASALAGNILGTVWLPSVLLLSLLKRQAHTAPERARQSAPVLAASAWLLPQFERESKPWTLLLVRGAGISGTHHEPRWADENCWCTGAGSGLRGAASAPPAMQGGPDPYSDAIAALAAGRQAEAPSELRAALASAAGGRSSPAAAAAPSSGSDRDATASPAASEATRSVSPAGDACPAAESSAEPVSSAAQPRYAWAKGADGAGGGAGAVGRPQQGVASQNPRQAQADLARGFAQQQEQREARPDGAVRVNPLGAVAVESSAEGNENAGPISPPAAVNAGEHCLSWLGVSSKGTSMVCSVSWLMEACEILMWCLSLQVLMQCPLPAHLRLPWTSSPTPHRPTLPMRHPPPPHTHPKAPHMLQRRATPWRRHRRSAAAPPLMTSPRQHRRRVVAVQPPGPLHPHPCPKLLRCHRPRLLRAQKYQRSPRIPRQGLHRRRSRRRSMHRCRRHAPRCGSSSRSRSSMAGRSPRRRRGWGPPRGTPPPARSASTAAALSWPTGCTASTAGWGRGPCRAWPPEASRRPGRPSSLRRRRRACLPRRAGRTSLAAKARLSCLARLQDAS